MFAPLLLCLASVIAFAVAVVLPGWQDWVMLAGPMLLGVAAIAFPAPSDYLTIDRCYRRTGDELDF